MGTISIIRVKNLLKKYRIQPSKGLGQNFLIDRGAIKKVIEAAELSSGDDVLEIGPGLGALTLELAKKANRVIAIEKDQKMVEILRDASRDHRNIEVIQGDILKIFNLQFTIFNKFSITNYKIVANLPFYLTAPVIRQFLESRRAKSSGIVLVVQKEVAQRICAKVPNMNLLAVSVQFYAQPKIISYISRKSFWPQPKVDSAIIRIDPQINTDEKTDSRKFFQVVRAGFSQPRKQLINNLSRGLKIDRTKITNWLSKNNIQPTQRAETLSLGSWINLTKSFKMN